MNIKELSAIRKLLITLVVPLVLYLMHLLAFIFIPMVGAFFIALLFAPVMRYLEKKGAHRILALVAVLGIIATGLVGTIEIVKLSSKEIVNADDSLWETMNFKLDKLIIDIQEAVGVSPASTSGIEDLLGKKDNSSMLFSGFGTSVQFLRSTIMMVLMTFFFLILYLAGSVNLYKLMGTIVFKKQITVKRSVIKIEKSIVKFIKVKFWLSLFTGIGFSVMCLIFDVSFPVFWGLFAFAINFIQMIGSVISTVVLALFAMAEIDNSGTLLIFALLIAGVQVLFGGILEPVFMGQTFAINTVTVLMMLMLWGFIWGIPGLIMSIPITVLLKIILEHHPPTQKIGALMN